MPHPRRKVRDQRDAEQLLDALEASSHDLPGFCRAHGIDGRSLACWRRNLARRREAAKPAGPALRLVELTEPRPRSRYRLRVDDVQIEVDDDFSDETLARLLDVVRSC